jgi:hypothetical protein
MYTLIDILFWASGIWILVLMSSCLLSLWFKPVLTVGTHDTLFVVTIFVLTLMIKAK